MIAMHAIEGVGWHTIDRLITVGWTPGEPVTSGLLDDLLKTGVPAKTVESIRSTWSRDREDQTEELLDKLGIDTVTVYDGDLYPKRLREIAQPPWVLYVKGDKGLLTRPSLAVVGTRKPTPYGLRMTGLLVRELASAGMVIVSGMAAGIDGEAHRAALDAGGMTVAVLGSGVDVVYPPSHRRLYEKLVGEGAVISESPPGTRPLKGLFPRRNRLISGLSYGTLVVEAAERSGSLITADFSAEQGREVFAVPGPATSAQNRGTLRLIQQGAKCVIDAGDIFEELPWIRPGETVGTVGVADGDSLDGNDRMLLDRIGENPIHLADWMAGIGGSISPGEFHRRVLSLEMKGIIRRLPCGRYIRRHR